MRAAHFVRLGSVSLIAIAAAGCVETGDFGRPKPSIWNDVALPTTGSVAAHARAEPVSSFTYTDDEQELRDRAWRFLMPAHERAWFATILANLARTRILPATEHPTGVEAYHRALVDVPARSVASRYRRLGEDAAADRKLIAPFAAVASRVIAADAVRLRALPYVGSLNHADRDHAVARVAENRCLIDWVRHETHGRLEEYRYALEHLFIEGPQNEAVPAERSLAELATQRQTLDALAAASGLAWCAGPMLEVQAVAGRGRGVPPERPLVVKD